jgi:hypothetical protein
MQNNPLPAGPAAPRFIFISYREFKKNRPNTSVNNFRERLSLYRQMQIHYSVEESSGKNLKNGQGENKK